MDRETVCAVLARMQRLYAHHLSALVSAAGGDFTRSLELEALGTVDLSPTLRESLLAPRNPKVLAADLRWIESSGVRVLASTDSDYPQQLLQLKDAPTILFVRGDVHTLSSRQLAMVGARKATFAGRAQAQQFARYFVRAGLTVTSGLAAGIDAASHEGALQGGGATVAVCATGLDRVYPTQHRRLAERICASGALVSEFPPASSPRRENFPRRNRIISGLSEGALVVESARKSGSLITARRTRELGRTVFAIPGSIGNEVSRGCHQLIREGAHLVEEPAEVLRSLKISLPNEGVAGHTGHPGGCGVMDKGYEMLLDAVGFEPATVDVLVLRTGLTGESITSMLLALELEGHIASYPGGRFGRIP
jgi:DNA processing protein